MCPAKTNRPHFPGSTANWGGLVTQPCPPTVMQKASLLKGDKLAWLVTSPPLLSSLLFPSCLEQGRHGCHSSICHGITRGRITPKKASTGGHEPGFLAIQWLWHQPWAASPPDFCLHERRQSLCYLGFPFYTAKLKP